MQTEKQIFQIVEYGRRVVLGVGTQMFTEPLLQILKVFPMCA